MNDHQKYLRIIFLVLFFLSAAAVSVSAQLITRQILKRVEANSKSLSSLKGNIRLTQFDALLRETDVSEGEINFLQATKASMYIRIDWTKPVVEHLVVANGRYVLYSPGRQQMVLGSFDRRMDGVPITSEFFTLMNMPRAELIMSHDVRYKGEETINSIKTWHLELIPRKAAAYRIVGLWFDANGMPIQTRIVRENNDVATVLLHDVQRNVTLNSSVFKIIPPKGTSIIRGLTAFPEDYTSRFDAAKMRERVIRLSADDFEGRGPGTAGGKRAAQYIADQMKASGVKPATKAGYFQNVRLVGVKADPKTALNVGSQSFKFGDDFVATTSAQSADVSIDADLVFAGYGIDAPIYNWNDYSGNANDYRGKVLMILVNDPPATTAEPKLFGDKALTYYGRWTYKFEEAARRGAAGVILIHTTESAGYGWNVIRTSNGNWRYEIARTPGDTSPFLKMKSWVTNDTASKILKGASLDIDDLRAKARVRGFKPIDTGLKVKLDLKSEMQTFDSPNVVGIVEGSDKKLRNEVVVYTAHWDHLGIGEPDAGGDKIFNGAYDNASGVSAVLGIAEAFAKMPMAERPKRSILFLFPTAEEQGLLGAEYYSLHPLVPLSRTAANVNIDGVNFFGKTRDFSALGADRSSIEDVINEAAKERSLTVEGDMRPEQGFFFRSDHFPFAKVGVPALSLRHGDDFVTPLKGEVEAFFKDYTAKYYHQASDEYKEWWDTSAMIQEAELGLAIGAKLANLPAMPRYKDSDEFSAADKARFK